MSSTGRYGKPDEEMFLQRPSEPKTPTVEPLRIYKRESTSPEPRAPSAASQRSGFAQPTAFSLPPGASSSPKPLPYPDDRQRTHQRAPNGRTGKVTFADQPTTLAPGNGSTFYDSSTPPRSDSPDYERPTHAPEYPPALRPRDGRDGQQQVPASRLADRRQNIPKPLPDSPGPDTPEKEGLFQRMPRQEPNPLKLSSPNPRPLQQADPNTYLDYRHQYFPPPEESGPSGLTVPNVSSVNRLSSSASTSTTRAQRGSPPPPETPIIPPSELPGGGIEARYAAAGIAGTSTLTSLQASNAAAAQRANQYPVQPLRGQTPAGQQQQEPARRPWTPTELPGNQPHGPPTVYQGVGDPSHHPSAQSPTPQGHQATSPRRPSRPSALEQDFQRLQVTASPPPAYSPSAAQGGAAGTTAQGYPNEKQGHRPGAIPASVAAAAAAGAAGAAGATAAAPHVEAPIPGHPAFANEQRRQSGPSPQPGPEHVVSTSQQHAHTTPEPLGAGPGSPPPLPEGWIAHLDPNSGQYYYIHLPTQSTQWEFPKGPTPLNLNEPLSPVASSYGGHPLASPGFGPYSGKPLASPGFQPSTPGFAESFMPSTPTVTGFSGPPPGSGIDMYKVAPTNGVYFGPYLRYTNMDLERGIWLGSILLVTDAPQPPTIHIHQSVDLSPNPRQLKANPISHHQRWTFYRYDIDLKMDDSAGAKWTYAITSHLGCTRYEFLVAGRNETGWRFIATSGNDFSLNVNANERSRLGGIGYLWKDIMQKNVECGGFHAQLGLGDQIYADRLWKELPLLKQWLAMSGKENRKNAPWTAKHEEDVSHAYFHYYTSHFDQPFLREAFAQIPHVLQIDDHDIFDGFGSYPEYMQFSNMFKNIGRIGIENYLLFQHHTTLEILRNVSTDIDIFTITGTGWHFIKYLGPAVVVVGPDCRSERNQQQVMAGPTYQGLFPKVAMLPPSVQHCIWMIVVPIVYPRLEAAEQIAHTVATGKKAVTGAYNVVGKVTSSVAGIVGAKGVVGSGFDSVKKAVGKSGLMGGILSPFGDIDMLDELRDMWTHESKDLERTYLIRTLQGISHQRSLRITFLSGAVDCCGAGLLHDPAHPSDHKTMYQLISASVVNTPPPSYLLKLLHTNKPLYLPANGYRSTNQPSDTKEDMMEIFQVEPDGRAREQKRLMGRRNWVACVAFDPEVVRGTFGATDMGRGGGRLSLAADFMVQGDGGVGGGVSKYGPVVVPCLEFGR